MIIRRFGHATAGQASHPAARTLTRTGHPGVDNDEVAADLSGPLAAIRPDGSTADLMLPIEFRHGSVLRWVAWGLSAGSVNFPSC